METHQATRKEPQICEDSGTDSSREIKTQASGLITATVKNVLL